MDTTTGPEITENIVSEEVKRQNNEEEDIKNIFDFYATCGKISARNAEIACYQLGLPNAKFDFDMSFTIFQSRLRNMFRQQDTISLSHRLFTLLDKSKDMVVDADELYVTLHDELNLPLTRYDVDDFLRYVSRLELDADGRKRLTYWSRDNDMKLADLDMKTFLRKKISQDKLMASIHQSANKKNSNELEDDEFEENLDPSEVDDLSTLMRKAHPEINQNVKTTLVRIAFAEFLAFINQVV